MLRYCPGEWLAAFTPGTVALLSSALEEAAVERAWLAMSEGEGFGAVLGALVGSFGTSMSALPAFAVVSYDAAAGTANVVVRGALQARVAEVDGTVHEVSGLGVTTWQERTVENAAYIAVAEPGAASSTLPLRDGVVRASRVDWVVRGAKPSGETTGPLAAGVVESDTPDALTGGPHPPADSVPVHEAGRASESEPLVEVEPEAAHNSEAQVVPASGETTVLPGVTRTMDSGDAIGRTVADPFDQTTGYDDLLFGETRISSVEGAAVRAAAEATEVAAAAVPAPPPPPPPAAMPPQPSVPPVSIGMIGAIPQATPPRLDQTAGATHLGDHDGETVSAEQLAAVLAAAPATTLPPQEHPGVPQNARPAPTLVVSTGERIVLDRGAVVGRRPRALRATGVVPHLVTVASPSQDISRSHVELRVDGADVVAVDLDTVNGTKLLRQGAEPLRLHPGEPTLLIGSDRLDLGDGIVLSFEGLR